MLPQSGAMTTDPATQTFYDLMYRYAHDRAKRFDDGTWKVAHYTSAENALNIIRGKTIWLRNAALMNDFLEISYGRSCIAEVLANRLSHLQLVLQSKHPGLAEEIVTWLSEVETVATNHTYLTSFAEHNQDDYLGKLSMWRAYGGPIAGAAIIFNTEVFQSDNDQINVFAHPVTYGADAFAEHFQNMLNILLQSQDLLAQVPRESAKSVIFHSLRDLMLTTKHPGFREEQEWRIIHSPSLFASAFVQHEIVSVAGIPQAVYKVPLEDRPGLNMPELNLDKIIHKVIVGPCQYPQQVAFALHVALDAAGVTNSGDRITISDIPLRQRG